MRVLLHILLLIGGAASLAAQGQEPTLPTLAQPLGDFLREDGSLDLSSNIHGQLDPTGWRMELAPDGSPRFKKSPSPSLLAAAHPDDIYWDERFNIGGAGGAIYTVAISGCQDVYIGGRFTFIGDIIANNIARWDGSQWHTLGEGLRAGQRNAAVTAITVNGEDVYVGGAFDSAGTKQATNVARWTGLDWLALGSGLGQPGDTVLALAVDGNTLFAGGRFAASGNISTGPIARCDLRNSSWSTMGPGLSGDTIVVNDIALYGQDLFAGGKFARAGGLPLKNLARWNATTASWNDVGGGINGTVEAVAVHGNDLYVGGSFTQAGTVAALNIARRDLTERTWNPMGSGLNGSVSGIDVTGGRVFAVGRFRNAGTQVVNRIAVWETGSWERLGKSEEIGLNNDAYDVVIGGTSVYIVGKFTRAGSLGAYGAALWNLATRTWGSFDITVGEGVNGPIYAIGINGRDVYVGGRFSIAGSIRANAVAKWNGIAGTWSPLGTGVGVVDTTTGSTPVVYSIAVNGRDVYVGGRFDRAGQVQSHNIAHWNGGVWRSMNEGIGYNYQGGTYDSASKVFAVAVRNNEVFVGGQFDLAGGKRANRVARWDQATQTWSPLGNGLGGSSFYTFAQAIAADANNVYVGGVFPTAGNVNAKNIARWDGNQWSILGTGNQNGVNNSVYAIQITKDGEVVVGGDFTIAGATPVKNIAIWRNNAWTDPGGGVNGKVYAIDTANDGIYVGGSFNLGGNQVLSRIGRWDGSTWTNLGSGTGRVGPGETVVRAIGSTGPEVYAGGEFTLAGQHPSYNIGRWFKGLPGMISSADDPNGTTPSGSQTIWLDRASGQLYLRGSFPHPATLQLMNVRGQQTGEPLLVEAGQSHQLWAIADLPNGLYFCRIQMEGVTKVLPVMIAR